MRNTNNNSSSGVGGILVLIPIVFVCGLLTIIAATRAEVFKPQPSQAVVSAAYATRARIENDATRDELAANLTHIKSVQRIERDFLQTGKDLLIVAGGVGVLALLALTGTTSMRLFGQARLRANVINPNRRGQFGVYVDRKRGLMVNPNMQTQPALDMSDPRSLSDELQLEAYAWYQRANIASSMSDTKILPLTATQERGLLRAAAWPALPTPGKPPVVIGATEPVAMPNADDTTGIHMHDDLAQGAAQAKPARAVVNTSHGDLPNDITSEQEFNDYLSSRH